MTNGDYIRQMSDDELVDLLVWGTAGLYNDVPDCSDDCPYFDNGCANGCPHNRREQNVRNWLEEECE